jgi:hypothetical protein
MVKTTTKRVLVNPWKAREKISTRRANPRTKVRGKARKVSNATNVVILIILQRSAIYPST